MDLNLQPKPQGQTPEATTQSFEHDVLRRSFEKPVVVDFWAPWCGPCRQLMPLLEKAVAAARGAVHLVKVNIDQNPELAQALRVQSVPTVYAFFQGRPVDGFMGAQPESALKAFVDKLSALSGGAAAEEGGEAGRGDSALAAQLLAEGDKIFRDGDAQRAMEKYGLALDADPACAAALGGIGWCLLAAGDAESVRELVSQCDAEQAKEPRIKGLCFVLDAGRDAKPPAGAATPDDLYDAALYALSRADLAGAVDALLELTRRDREWREQKARKLLLSLFEAMGPHHPLTVTGRRGLSSVLFS